MERQVLQTRVSAAERFVERFSALAAEGSTEPAELWEAAHVELSAKRGDTEHERTERGETGHRLQAGPAIGAEVEVGELRQLLEQRQVTEVEAQCTCVHLTRLGDHRCGVGVVVACVPEPPVGLDRVDERRRQAVGRLRREIDALEFPARDRKGGFHANVCSLKLRGWH